MQKKSNRSEKRKTGTTPTSLMVYVSYYEIYSYHHSHHNLSISINSPRERIASTSQNMKKKKEKRKKWGSSDDDGSRRKMEKVSFLFRVFQQQSKKNEGAHKKGEHFKKMGTRLVDTCKTCTNL